MNDQKAGAETPAVLLLDPQKLRREGIAKLLAPWCNQNCLGLTAVGPTGLPFEIGAKLDYCLVLINVGSQRIDHRDPADCIDRVVSLLPSTPVIILSDSDAPTEVVAAFQAGASAFIPTAMVWRWRC